MLKNMAQFLTLCGNTHLLCISNQKSATLASSFPK
jgi:hypothetical protein